jgi:choline dehydrogenase-like flavoprotein
MLAPTELEMHVLKWKCMRAEGSAKPVAYGVVFTDPMGVQHRVYLRGGGKSEVILAAGTLGSPQLLMLSGVGPRGQLEKHGIRAVMDHPMVGQGVADNPMNSVFVPSPVPVTLSLVQIVGVTRFGSFIEGVSGSQFGIPLHARAPRRRSHSFGMFSPMVRTDWSTPSPNFKRGNGIGMTPVVTCRRGSWGRCRRARGRRRRCGGRRRR